MSLEIRTSHCSWMPAPPGTLAHMGQSVSGWGCNGPWRQPSQLRPQGGGIGGGGEKTGGRRVVQKGDFFPKRPSCPFFLVGGALRMIFFLFFFLEKTVQRVSSHCQAGSLRGERGRRGGGGGGGERQSLNGFVTRNLEAQILSGTKLQGWEDFSEVYME